MEDVGMSKPKKHANNVLLGSSGDLRFTQNNFYIKALE